MALLATHWSSKWSGEVYIEDHVGWRRLGRLLVSEEEYMGLGEDEDFKED